MTATSEPMVAKPVLPDQTERKLSAGELKLLASKANGPGLRRLAFHLTSLIASGSGLWVLRETWWIVPLSLAHGYILAFLFCAQHESAHRTAFRSKAINDAVGHLIGFILLLPLNNFRAFHWDHHRYTQDPQRDPELSNGLPTTRARLAWTWFGGPNWSSRIYSFWRHAVIARADSAWIPASSRAAIVREARCYLAGYLVLLVTSFALQTTVLIWLWLIPMVCGYWFLRPYLLSEHTGCPNEGDMFDKTRTTASNWFVHAFAWNMPYHTEHHVYPAVPFHALPLLHAKIADRLVNTEPGYVTAWRRVCRHLTNETV